MAVLREETRMRLDELNSTLATCALLIKSHQEVLDQFFDEAEHMASVGPILDPTLFNSSERRATEALLTPIYKAARDFVLTYDEQIAKAKTALGKVVGASS